MIVKVKFINEEARELYLKASGKLESVFPFKKYDRDFCYDVVATSCKQIAPNVYKYGIGLAFQICRGPELIEIERRDGWAKCMEFDTSLSPFNLSIDLRPRSSVWETGMVLSNCTGTVDELYTGEVSAVFYHLFPDMPIYKVGDKIGQIKVGVTFPMMFIEASELDSTDRGNGGYGSTGK